MIKRYKMEDKKPHIAPIEKETKEMLNIIKRSAISSLIISDRRSHCIVHNIRFLNTSQWARKMKKVQAKKLVKSNKSKNVFVKLHFWQFSPVQEMIFENAKNGIWSKKIS